MNSSRLARVVSVLGPCGTCGKMVSWPMGGQPVLCPTLWQSKSISAGTSNEARRNDLLGLVQTRQTGCSDPDTILSGKVESN